MSEFVDGDPDDGNMTSRHFSSASARLKSIKKRLKNGKYISVSFGKKKGKYSNELFYDLVFLNKTVRNLLGKKSYPPVDEILTAARISDIHRKVFSKIYNFALEHFNSSTCVSVDAAYSVFCHKMAERKLP